MRQVVSLSRRTTADGITHLIKYLMQTMFHAWLSACVPPAARAHVCVCEIDIKQLLVRAVSQQKMAADVLILLDTHHTHTHMHR